MDFAGMKVRLFADGADLDSILKLNLKPYIQGFTTNPTLMRKAGVTDYEAFSRKLLELIPDKPVSLEVFADDLSSMERQARAIGAWGANVYVKIPVCTTTGESTAPIVARLSGDGLALNVTAILCEEQVRATAGALDSAAPSIVSVFAGRIADTGIDPMPLMRRALDVLKPLPRAELLWASPRELLNIVQADQIGCHIVTVGPDLLNKLPLIGKDLETYSRETVQMFYGDAVASGFTIDCERH